MESDERQIHVSETVAAKASELLQQVANGEIGISNTRFGAMLGNAYSANVDRHIVDRLGFLASQGPGADAARAGVAAAQLASAKVDGQFSDPPLLRAPVLRFLFGTVSGLIDGVRCTQLCSREQPLGLTRAR